VSSVESSVGLVPVVPGYVPLALLCALEAAALLGWPIAFGRRLPDDSEAPRCARCARLHARTEAFGRGADAVAVGALAFLVALPFVAAGYETGFTFANAVLGVSAVAGVIGVAAEADFFAHAAASRLWRQFGWRTDPARIVGGGARWLGALFVLYLFQPRDAGVAALFGDAGKRLVQDLGSAWTIMAAATIIAGACVVSVAARWLVPLIAGSLPAALAARREPHGTAT
jgi:hypothetical protein